MGYNLERLKRQYGLGSASKLGYLGTTEADKAAYDKYSDEFLLRLKNRPMYANQQFVGSDLPGNYYDNILGAPVYGEGEPVTGPVDPDPVPITTPVVTPGSGINGGGNGGNGKSQWGNDANIEHLKRTGAFDSNGEASPGTSTLSDLFNNSMYGKFFEGVSDVFGNEGTTYYGSKAPYGMGVGQPDHEKYMTGAPAWDQFTYARTPEERANPSGASVWTTGTGAPVLDGNQQAVRTSNYRPPVSSRMSRDIVAPRTGHPSFMYNSPVTSPLGALSNITGQQFTGANTGALYDANEFSGTGMAMGSDFAPAPIATATVAPAPVLVDPGADFLARSQALSNEFNIPLGEAFDLADKISQQTTSNIQSVIPPSGGGGGGGGNNPPAPSAPARGSTARSDRGPGRKGRQAAASNKSATSRSANPQRSSGGYSWGLAEGGHIKGYAMGGPEDRYSTEEEIVLNATVPDVSLEADVLDESLSMQGLIDQQTANATGASSNTSDMLEMLKQSQVNYGDQIATQQGEYNTETKALQDMMNQMADSQSTGPSESEKWFRIAAAMGAPTKTGSFFENLGLANVAMADISKERREATTAGDLVKMRAAEFGLGLLKDQLSSTKTMSAAQLQRNQNIQDRIMEWDFEAARTSEENIFNLMTIKEQRLWETENRKSIPQTAAGLAAEEAGYDKGTPEYEEFVKAVVDRETRIQKLNIEALERKASSLTKPEIDARKEADKDIKSTEGAIKLLKEALELSPKAYAGDWYSVTKKALQGAIDSDDQKYKDSERLENLLSQGALATLKATFGGNISDGERAANLEITGAKMKSEKSRTETIKLALETMREYEKEANDRLKDILSGDYVKRTESTR